MLVVHDKLNPDSDHTPIATFTQQKKGLFTKHPHGASLSVTSEGMSIIDEIIATIVWFDDKRRLTEEVVIASTVANA